MSEEIAKAVESVIGRATEKEELTSYKGDIWGYLRKNMPYIRNAWESYHHPAAICGARGCIRACMIHLEEEGKIKNLFKNPFRIRKPWRL